MSRFGDGSEERADALLFALRLAGDPQVTRRRNTYNNLVNKARNHAKSLPKNEVIDRLIEKNPGYIRERLEAEGSCASLIERYARTFWKDYE